MRVIAWLSGLASLTTPHTKPSDSASRVRGFAIIVLRGSNIAKLKETSVLSDAINPTVKESQVMNAGRDLIINVQIPLIGEFFAGLLSILHQEDIQVKKLSYWLVYRTSRPSVQHTTLAKVILVRFVSMELANHS